MVLNMNKNILRIIIVFFIISLSFSCNKADMKISEITLDEIKTLNIPEKKGKVNKYNIVRLWGGEHRYGGLFLNIMKKNIFNYAAAESGILPGGIWKIYNGYLITEVTNGEPPDIGKLNYWDLTNDYNQIIYTQIIYQPNQESKIHFYNNQIFQKPNKEVIYKSLKVITMKYKEYPLKNNSKIFLKPDKKSEVISFYYFTLCDSNNSYNYHPKGFPVYTAAKFKNKDELWILINYFGYAGCLYEGWIESNNIDYQKKTEKDLWKNEVVFQNEIWDIWESPDKLEIIQLNKELIENQEIMKI